MNLAYAAALGLAVGIAGEMMQAGPVAIVACVLLLVVPGTSVRVLGVAITAGIVVMSAHAAWLGTLTPAAGVQLCGVVSSHSVHDHRTVLVMDASCSHPGYRGRVQVYAAGALELNQGDRVVVTGDLLPVSGPRNPGEYDGRGGLWSARIHYRLWTSSDRVRVLEQSRGWSLIRLRARVARVLTADGPGSGLLLAVTTGDRSALTGEQREDLARAGIGHLTAVSGFHMGLVVAFTRYAVRTGHRWPVILAVAAYLVLVGLRPSILRAAIMALVGVMGLRPGARFQGLALAVCGVLVINPWALVDPSFHLSLAATWGILLPGAMTDRGWRSVAVVTVRAQAGSVMAAAWHFGLMSIAGVPLNLVAAPLATTATAGGLLVAVLAWCPPLAETVGVVARLPARVLEWMARHVSALPLAAVTWPQPHPSLVIGWYLVPGLWIWGRRRLAIAVLLLCVTVAAMPGPRQVEVIVFDVGQGDAIMVVTPGGRRVLVDVGPDDRLCRLLPRLGRRAPDIVFITHAHHDHVGGLPALAETMPPAVVADHGRPIYQSHQRLRQTLSHSGIPVVGVEAGNRIVVDGVSFLVLHPPADWPDGSENDRSLVIRVDYGGFSLLLTGDVEEAGERRLSAEVASQLSVDVLKVAHHGSSTSSSPGFLTAASPVAAVISVGRFNRHGHPGSDVLERLEEFGVAVYRTDLSGAIRIRSDGARWWLDTMLPAPIIPGLYRWNPSQHLQRVRVKPAA